ncbi:MAG: M67 family metallopeptidase [Bryobacteraceae bacterium]|nr:M67 family metallopeptidase [Bryobacteraceae bacterium]
MLTVNSSAWRVMTSHAEATYPRECCGVMLGTVEGDDKQVTLAYALDNAYEGGQEDRYEIRPTDLLRVEREARAQKLSVIGIFHSHPDCDAYFSKTDLEHSCPWYSFVVLSVQRGHYHHANSFLPNADQTHAEPEPLRVP